MAKKTADTEVDKIVRQVQQEMQVLVKAYGEELGKVHPGEETSDESKPDESAADPAPVDGAPPDASAGGPPPGGPPGDASAPGADAGAPPGGPGDPAADAGGGPPDPMALEAEFDKMPVPEAMAYYQAVKASLSKRMGAGAGGDASAGGPPGAAPMAPPMAPPPGGPPADMSAPPPGPPAMKSEPVMKTEAQWRAEHDFALAKAEAATTKAELDKAIKALNDVSGKLTKYETELKGAAKMIEDFRTAPTRKAITGISDLAKSEPAKTEDAEDPRESLTTEQLNKRLRDLARAPGLTKSDRTAVGTYAVHRTDDNFTKIKHLFAAKAAA